MRGLDLPTVRKGAACFAVALALGLAALHGWELRALLPRPWRRRPSRLARTAGRLARASRGHPGPRPAPAPEAYDGRWGQGL